MFRPAFLIAAACALSSATALSAAPVLDIHPTTTPPKIDGVLSPGEWDRAAHSDDFRQIEPQENAAPREHTEFWATYDTDYLYVAVRCHDTAGRAGIRAYSMQRDQDNGSDDIVRIVLDTFHRQNDGYYFALTAAGGRHDGLVQNKDDANPEWDSIWLGRTSIDDAGWSAEFTIPVKSLSFDPANDVWGFDVARAVRRTQEVMRWAGRVRNKPTTSLPNLGTLRGLTGLRQGRGLDFKPFASLTRRSAPQSGEKTADFKPGFDLVWHVTPSLAATFTVNTDFADAEVDERQVNLGRFSLFFPEKRSFFTQDASLFTFAGLREDPLPFFSRRIGLADDGTKVDLRGGVKLTGRTGPLTLGLLDVQTAAHEGLDAKNLLVGRAAVQVLGESSAGLIFTHGDPRFNGDNTLVGADFNYLNSHLADRKTVAAHAAIQATDSDFAGGRGTAATLALDYPNDPFTAFVFFSRIDSRFEPALGFVPRTGIRDHHLFTRYRWYRDNFWLRRIDLVAEADLVTDLRGRRLDDTLWFPALEAGTPAGDFLNFQVQRHRERLDTPFAIRPGIVIPVGDYAWTQFQFLYFSNRSRPVNLEIQWRRLGFYTGHRDDYELALGWRPSRHLELNAGWKLREIRLPEGNFNLRIGSAKAVYTFTPDLQLSLLAQYDNFSDQLGVNLRLKWVVQPGNEIFAIVNEGYDTSLDHFRPVQNDTSLKAAWTYRF
ncbi:MAG: carbohydrate binding family 9 domain-containing protein [Opitutae bacterium]|nr:carbohydrate binding family 9 domain-containing protein [Opitutae bacterium]